MSFFTLQVKIGLQIKARLEYVSKLNIQDEAYLWVFKAKCTNCGEVTKHMDFTRFDEEALSGGRGHAMLHYKCKLCSRENHMSLLPLTLQPYYGIESENFKTIAEFDCRGLELVDFIPTKGWRVEVENSHKKFDDVDLAETEWMDYDDCAKVSVGVYELEHHFVKIP
ncbi:unnamed protein product [Notodromas monacha]|uniref:CXXC motif containing zinc binding protein n=1 Tax=Notodromas monacha TaxID=399045 RepID=A0A7R9G8X1_9CRUS|nr:unnamed protein product [Notodromas monacha]CAG0913715.1 unnamed protein product [Notodromas monacha]